MSPDGMAWTCCEATSFGTLKMSPSRNRLDQVLVDRGLFESREKAKRSIMAGNVLVDGHPITKPGHPVKADQPIDLKKTEPFVSRGGLKLDHALQQFPLAVQGLVAADLGASTGGFTDCLLQHQCSKVYAIDVGSGQLAWKLRQDERVIVMERINARHLKATDLPEPMDLVVIDCSFISLRQILPAARDILGEAGDVVALIKPQFEAGKTAVDKGKGVIKDPEIHREVIESLQTFATRELSMDWKEVTPSPIMGPAGNKEFLVWLQHHANSHESHRTDSQS